MEYDWDPAKNDENLQRRGFDFAFASQIFRGIYVQYPDDRADYGERRMIALGLAEGLPLSVVFTDRIRTDGTQVRRIISARVSNRKERTRYGKAIQVL
ncbi:MAG: BrnT family toxin [Gemmatimonadaceae bacterium]|nr:BrnT family toxin [Gemmatimonadaceae bacterium]